MAVTDNNIVAIVVPAIAREGISKLVLSQIRGFEAQQYRVVMIVLSDVLPGVFEEMNIFLSTDRILVLEQKDAYLSVRNLFNSYDILNPIKRFLKYHNATVVIAHAPYAHFVMRLMKLRLQYSDFKIKLIQYFHITQYAQFPLNSIRRIVINILSKALGEAYDDEHIFVSAAVKEDIEYNLFRSSNSTIVYNVLPVLKESDNSFDKHILVENGAFLIVLPGRVGYEKGQLFFIEVLKCFIQSRSIRSNDLHIYVIGEGLQREGLEKKIVSYELSNFVSLLGALPNEAVLDYISKANLVVLPSFFEGLPLVALEAMQMKTLLLTSDIAPFQEIINHGQNGFMFRAGDAADCLAKLQYIYDNRADKLIDLDKVAQQIEEKFSFQHHMQQLIEVINKHKIH